MTKGPFSLAELNRAYHRAIKRTESGAADEKSDDFLVLLRDLQPSEDGMIDLEMAARTFRKAEPLLTLPKVSEDSWSYAWMHLPSAIMDHEKIHFVLHTPAKQFIPSDPDAYINVFAGWSVEGGAYLESDKCEEGVACTIHINLRDLRTDLYEFLSNLLMHMQFLDENPGMVIQACHDVKDREKSCRGRNKCWLHTSNVGDTTSVPTCLGVFRSFQKAPAYTVEVKGMGGGDKRVIQKLDDLWRPWATELRDASAKLTKCAAEELKVHVIQGATEVIWVMTSEYAWSGYYPESDLKGKHGGPFKEQDRHYAHLMKAMKGNSSIMAKLNAGNVNKHTFVGMNGPQSVNTEIIGLASWEAGKVDPVITEKLLADTAEGRKCGVLLSIGYAFGTSALPMGRALKEVFGRGLKSFYVVGKAGGLMGQVGDYQIPDTFMLWKDVRNPSSAEIYHADTSGVHKNLWSGVANGNVHIGSVMTVPSVVLQSNALLETAREAPWKATGIEMESFWFKKALPHIPGLFLYYTSDLPQCHESSLAHESFPWEEGQTLFNGLARMAFVHMLGLIKSPPSTVTETGSDELPDCKDVAPESYPGFCDPDVSEKACYHKTKAIGEVDVHWQCSNPEDPDTITQESCDGRGWTYMGPSNNPSTTEKGKQPTVLYKQDNFYQGACKFSNSKLSRPLHVGRGKLQGREATDSTTTTLASGKEAKSTISTTVSSVSSIMSTDKSGEETGTTSTVTTTKSAGTRLAVPLAGIGLAFLLAILQGPCI